MQYRVVKHGDPDKVIYLHSEKQLLSWLFSKIKELPCKSYYTIDLVKTDSIEWGTKGYSRRRVEKKKEIDVRRALGQRPVALSAMDAINFIITSVSDATLHEMDCYIAADIAGNAFEAVCNKGKWETPKLNEQPFEYEGPEC